MPTRPLLPSQLTPTDEALLADVAQLVDKPLAFVYWAFPWGLPGALAHEDGPDTWQREVLLELEHSLRTTDGAVRIAVSSGNGIGKGALTAWVVLWFNVTRPNGQGVVTANTADQLTSKTWREVAKWHNLSRVKHWGVWQATKFSHAWSPETWYVSALPWSEHRSEAMAGTHEDHVLIVQDEASAIPDLIWDTLEGAMTTKGSIWLAFGNPTRNTGRFKEIFPPGRFAHRWQTHRIDSRTCKQPNQAQLRQWIEDYGEDSDFVKIHVKGEHPAQSEAQFIGEDLVQLALHREVAPFLHLPKVLGVDVARTGSARTVLLMRQGCKILWAREWRNKRVDEVATLVRSSMELERPDATFIDAVGIGAGVYDLLRHTGHNVIAVNGAGAVPDTVSLPSLPSEKDLYYNMRACMWGRMRQWLEEWGCLPPELTDLILELQAPEYTYANKDRILLESKEHMLERGVVSPDYADALSLTFFAQVRPAQRNQPQQYAKTAASPFQRGGQPTMVASSGWGGRR